MQFLIVLNQLILEKEIDMMRKNILICEFSQESNSFNPIVWDTDRFKSMVMCGGIKMRTIYSLLKSPVKGMADVVRKHSGKITYGFAMRAVSGGPVSDESVEIFIENVLKHIKKKEFDGILISLHGATVSESEEDACGYIVHKIRQHAPKAVIGLSCDMHANVTKKMEDNADFICGFQTYPHIDFYETGCRAAKLVMEKLEGGTASQVYYRIPMIVPASGYTSHNGTFKEILDVGKALVRRGEVGDFSLFMMQPWLDVKNAASCVSLVIQDRVAGLELAEMLAKKVFDSRKEFWPELYTAEDAVKRAVERIKLYRQDEAHTGPVILAEPSDSPNAGAVGDSVEVLRKIIEFPEKLKAAFCVMDPEAVKKAFEAGVGNEAEFSLGAGYTPGIGEPYVLTCNIKSLHKGKFRMAGPAGKGMMLSIGRTAVLEYNDVDIMVCEKPGGNGDLNFYRGFGIEPLDYDIVSVKANTSFRESYKEIASDIIVVDTYGAAGGRLTSLPFKNIDKENFYPFNENVVL